MIHPSSIFFFCFSFKKEKKKRNWLSVPRHRSSSSFSFPSFCVLSICILLLYLAMEGEVREGQVRGHRLLRVGLVVGALLLVQRCHFLAQPGRRMIVFLAVVAIIRVVEQKVRILVVGGGGGRRAAQQTVMMMRMMRMVGYEQRTAVHYDTGNSHTTNTTIVTFFSFN